MSQRKGGQKTARSDEAKPAEDAPAATKKPRFDPTKYGLSADFSLTDYTRLKGCSCKIPQPKLLELLLGISTDPGKKESDVGMDCSIVPVGQPLPLNGPNKPLEQQYLISTTDFFFPSVEDPYLQGRIGAANVLSDLYSMGIEKCDTMLMLLAASTDMEHDARYSVTLEIMRGFNDVCRAAETAVTGGQSVLNPWPLIGGVAMAVLPESRFVRPTGARAGDVFVLTKPLGHQLAVNLKQWHRHPSPLYKECIEGKMTGEEIDELYDAATENMARLNRNGARLMMKYKAHAATDVTGFGLFGHAKNLAVAQDERVTVEIHTMPILKGAIKGDKLMNNKYKLLAGLSAETSGGLFVALKDQATAEAFRKEIMELDGREAWIVGKALARPEGSSDVARITEDVKVIEVTQ